MNQCEMCKGRLNDKEPADSKVTIEEPRSTTEWIICDVCAAAVCEFILEFKEDVRRGFKNQDESWKLEKRVYLQQKLEVEP